MREILKIFDHSSIYILIAGSYTIIVLDALGDHSIAISMLIGEWIICFSGILMHIIGKESLLVEIIELSF